MVPIRIKYDPLWTFPFNCARPLRPAAVLWGWTMSANTPIKAVSPRLYLINSRIETPFIPMSCPDLSAAWPCSWSFVARFRACKKKCDQAASVVRDYSFINQMFRLFILNITIMHSKRGISKNITAWMVNWFITHYVFNPLHIMIATGLGLKH